MIKSIALISDAVHNLSDIAAMTFSYWAEKVTRRLGWKDGSLQPL
jgi:cobalt-zinc-cadmium efflux system protein